jgi:hypothetical protein
VSIDLLEPSPVSGPAPAGVGPGREDDVDPELLALPPPRRTEQRLTVALLFLVALTASAMTVSLRGEAAYAFSDAAGVDVGDLYAVSPTAIQGNSYVRGHGALGGALAVRFERPFERDTYRVWPVMGRRDVWVETRVPAGEEGSRYLPPTTFAGRVVRWSESGIRHRGLEATAAALSGQAIPAGAWLIVDGESPARARWALSLAVLFAGFAVWSVVTAARLLRRVE